MHCVVGCHRQVLEEPPSIGSVITVQHNGSYQSGTLRHPFFWRVRRDVPWEQLSQERRQTVHYADWTKQRNREKFFLHLQEKLGHSSKSDLYGLSPDDVRQAGGRGLLDKVYDGSVALALQDIFPDHKWMPWKFGEHVQTGFWNQHQNRRLFMESLAVDLGFKKMEDWYRASLRDVKNSGGTSLLTRYNNSLSKLLRDVFPEHEWASFGFEKLSSECWDNKGDQRRFIETISKKLNRRIEDWGKVTTESIQKRMGDTVLYKYQRLLGKYSKSPSLMIQTLYPNTTIRNK